MRSQLFASLLVLVAAGCAGTDETRTTSRPADTMQGSYRDYGDPMQRADWPAMKLDDLVAMADEFDGKFVKVQGEVVSVCAKKGCWLRMAPTGSEQNVFVKFTCPVNGRLIPMEAVGHQVVVEGQVTVEIQSEEDARHYAEDAGKSPEEIAKIVGERKEVSIQAPAARVLGLE